MGCGVSKPDDGLDDVIGKMARADHEAEEKKIKLLFLGPGDSGKSTLFKQLRMLYGDGISERELARMKRQLHGNVFDAVRVLTKACETLEIPIKDSSCAQTLCSYPSGTVLTPEIAEQVIKFWLDRGIQAAFQRRSEFTLDDSAPYLFTHVRRFATPEFVPTEEDVVHVRAKTSGIVEEALEFEGSPFVICDVGGQQNERRKWIHAFQAVTAVLFVAAVSEYDQATAENPEENRLVEAITLFEEIVNSPWFAEQDVILLLNKVDLFREKIKTVDIRQERPDGAILFPEYDGGCDFEAGLRYILNKFLERNKHPSKTVYYKFTTATDKDNVAHVFRSCQDIILRDNLRRGGFLEEDDSIFAVAAAAAGADSGRPRAHPSVSASNHHTPAGTAIVYEGGPATGGGGRAGGGSGGGGGE